MLYRANWLIKRNGTKFPKGGLIELTADEAARLLESGDIEPAEAEADVDSPAKAAKPAKK